MRWVHAPERVPEQERERAREQAPELHLRYATTAAARHHTRRRRATRRQAAGTHCSNGREARKRRARLHRTRARVAAARARHVNVAVPTGAHPLEQAAAFEEASARCEHREAPRCALEYRRPLRCKILDGRGPTCARKALLVLHDLQLPPPVSGACKPVRRNEEKLRRGR